MPLPQSVSDGTISIITDSADIYYPNIKKDIVHLLLLRKGMQKRIFDFFTAPKG